MVVRVSGLVLTALLATGAGAEAQDSTAARDSTGRPIPVLQPVVVTGTATPARVGHVGYAVSVLDAATLVRRMPASAADALRDLPASYIDEAVGPGGPTIVRLRGGEEVFTQILVDGVQINQNGGFFDFQGVTLTNIGRIEVARGPQSALYGSSAVSGVVQLLTPAGELGGPRFTLVAEGGTADDHGDAFRSEATVRGGAGAVRYSAGAGAAYARGIYALPHDTWTRDASLRVDVAAAPNLGVTATFRHIGVESNLPVRDPGATRVPLDPNARDERDRNVGSVQVGFEATPSWSHRLIVSAYREDFVFEDRFDDVAATAAYPFFIFDADFRLGSRLWRGAVDYVGTHRLLSGSRDPRLVVSYGGQWQREDLSDTTSGDFGDGRLSLDRNSSAGFAEVQVIPVAGLRALLGARVEKFGGLGVEMTPRASAVFELVPGRWSLRGAVGRAYKAPNLQQQFLDNPFIVSNPDLNPETSWSWELGTRFEVVEGKAVIDLGFFRQTYDDLIQLTPFGTTGQAMFRNLSSARVHGIEWSARWHPASMWSVGTAGSWIETKIVDNAGLPAAEFPEGEELPFRPTATISVFADVTPVRQLTVAAHGRYVGRQTVLTERFSGERRRLDDYFVSGLTARVAVTPGLSVYTRIENLYNTRYVTAFDRPGTPLTGSLGVRLTN